MPHEVLAARNIRTLLSLMSMVIKIKMQWETLTCAQFYQRTCRYHENYANINFLYLNNLHAQVTTNDDISFKAKLLTVFCLGIGSPETIIRDLNGCVG